MKVKKLLCAVMLSAMLVASLGATTVYAGSTISDSHNGISLGGSVRYASAPSGTVNGITATTTCGPANYLYAKAVVCYKVAGNKYTNSATNSSAGGGTSATATTNDVGVVYGGIGTHSVRVSGWEWNNKTTSIGENW